MTQLDLALTVAQQFIPGTQLPTLIPLGNGLINDTFLVTQQNFQWVLQRINHRVFPEPQWLLNNLTLLNQHIDQKTSPTWLKIPKLLETPDQAKFVLDSEGHYWRALQFIPDSFSKEYCQNLQDAAQIGKALGYFHRLCNDLNPSLLYDTLPGFHITPDYYQKYLQALPGAPNLAGSEAYIFCVDFIRQRQHLTPILEKAKKNQALRLRITHGDPKVNNFLFDHRTHNIISLVDLDTVKPALVHYDIGDCLRSACFNLQSTEFFNIDICEAILKSYLMEVTEFFNEADYDYLYTAIQLIPLELGMRFFTDYLQDNLYFKVTEPTQNLQRAVQQFHLCLSIERQHDSIIKLIKRLKSR